MYKRAFIMLTVITIVLTALSLQTPVARAGSLVSQGVVLTCTSLSGLIEFQATRDTTGSGSEQFVEDVIDGNGITLFLNLTQTVAIGSNGDYVGTGAVSGATANPITYRLRSLAGNGLGEDIIFSTQVSGCAGLPTAGECRVADGAYQGVVTADALLYWAVGKQTEPNKFIPAGQVVMIVSTPEPGWVYIKWACANYYIKADLLAPNPAKVSKPFGNFR